MKKIEDRWATVVANVSRAAERSNRSFESIKIVAVSKRHPGSRLREAYLAGVRCFGESYVQEALAKMEELGRAEEVQGIEWHFIGALQSNKAKKVVGPFALIHSVDRWSLAQALDRAARERQIQVRVLLELNVAKEKTKAGVNRNDLLALMTRISKETTLEVAGLMSFPPYCENPEDSRHHFQATRQALEELQSHKLPRCSLTELSMGVASDYEVAIEEGATIVRIGTAIFGERQ